MFAIFLLYFCPYIGRERERQTYTELADEGLSDQASRGSAFLPKDKERKRKQKGINGKGNSIDM